jgi:biotin-(acetyl-CoA carboxylase) ligase
MLRERASGRTRWGNGWVSDKSENLTLVEKNVILYYGNKAKNKIKKVLWLKE